MPRFRKWLTWETRTQDVMGRNFNSVYLSYVPNCFDAKIAFIKCPESSIDFASEYAFVSQILERNVKTTKSSEEVYKNA